MLEEHTEYRTETHHLFIDFASADDKLIRDRLLQALIHRDFK